MTRGDHKPRWLRERSRADGTRRLWWEPSAAARAAGFVTVELDANRPTWSRREAKRLNDEVDQTLAADGIRFARRGRTIEDLIEEYRKSQGFLTKAEKTRRSYTKNLKIILEKWGPHPAANFTKPVMFAWYETLVSSRGSHQAVALVRMMSILFSFSERIGWRPDNSNPCLRLGMSVPKGRDRAAAWTEFDALMSAARQLELEHMALGMGLSLLQGQRQTTVLQARRKDFHRVPMPSIDGTVTGEAWVWTFVRSKRQNKGISPIHPELVPLLELVLETAGEPDDPLLTDPRTGKAYTGDRFRKHFAQIRNVATREAPTLDGLQFRDLRRTFGHFSRAGGASKDDTADVLGNSAATDPALAEIYMAPQLATALRAVMAIRRPEEKQERKIG